MECHRTIEFRHPGGTVEAEKALPWILFCLGFVEQSRKVARVTNTEALVPADTKIGMGALPLAVLALGAAAGPDRVPLRVVGRHQESGQTEGEIVLIVEDEAILRRRSP